MKQKMTKDELVKEIARELNKTQLEVKSVIETMLEVMLDNLSKGKDIALNGSFNFAVVDVPEREMNNQITKGVVVVPAHKKIKVKVSKSWQDQVREV